MPTVLEWQLRRLAALADPVRRAVYLFVVERGEASRDQAARAVRISRALAAFHLDKLTAQGLLAARYQRLTKRRGPGAGRPAKLYHRARGQFTVSLPDREYELAARLFADVLAAKRGAALPRLRRAARSHGRRAGAAASPGRRGFINLLRHHGYEPERRPDETIVLRNCPFDALVQSHRPVVCGMNAALLQGMRSGAALAGYRVATCTEPNLCCAKLQPTGGRRRRAR